MPFRTDGSHYLDVFEKQARLINSRNQHLKREWWVTLKKG